MNVLEQIKKNAGLLESREADKFSLLIKELIQLAEYLDSYGSSESMNGSVAASEIKQLISVYV